MDVICVMNPLRQDAYSTPDLDMPTTCGSFALSGAVAKAHAVVVDELIRAGLSSLANQTCL